MTAVRPPDAEPSSAAHSDLLLAFQAGSRAALARAISIVENQRRGFRELLNALQPRLGRAHRIGVTGPPGAGKSTLARALAAAYRGRGETVAIVAVDPTSPYTGGALLGDRIRMNELALDEGVFIRSMATRGSLGGLALTTKEVADVMDAFGFDRVVIETVGVGQSELGVASAVDTTAVVLVPESGDSIQAMKAGLMEASDIFVINKADRPGADRMAREVSMMLHLRLGKALRNVPAHHGVDLRRAAGAAGRGAEADGAVAPGEWEVPVLQTVAEAGQGVAELMETLDRHRAWLGESGERDARRGARLAERVREEVDRVVRQRVWSGGQALLEANRAALQNGDLTPYELAARIVDESGVQAKPAEPPRATRG